MVNPVSSSLRVLATPNPIIHQSRHTIYYFHNFEMLYATAITYLVAVENEMLMHWENDTDGQHTHELEYTIGFKSLTSTALSKKIALSASLEGLEISDDNAGIHKTFVPEEFLPERRLKTQIIVPGRSDLYFYQRKYVLETEVYFTHDAWNKLCVVMKNDNSQIKSWKIRSTIHSAEFTTTGRELRKILEKKISGQTKQEVYGKSGRKFDDLTGRAKDTLKEFN
ncbi:hypothetical protein V8B97DRAFT_1867518 [Scleroderma yunnanense]